MTIRETFTMRDAALAYARRGWRVFPVAGKVPRLAAWPTQATTDEATVRRWWLTWPTADLGIATGGGLLVLDVDPRHGGDASLAELVRWAVRERLERLAALRDDGPGARP